MIKVVNLCVCAFLLLSLGSSQELPQTIDLFVTYRDFLPAACLTDVGRGQVLTDNWGITESIGQRTVCSRLSGDDQYGPALQSGQISGHPDFNAAGMFTDQDICNTAGQFDINFPIGSCVNAGGDISHSVVGDFLETGDNGIPKAPYCSAANDDCGATIQEFDSGNRETQGIREFYDTWFNDDPVFNKRIGLRLELTLANANIGQYKFSSDDEDPSAADFPQDNANNFFGPLNQFKRGGSVEVNINTPIAEAKAWPFTEFNLLGQEERSFWFTSELHTTFEFRDGPNDVMTFTFSGDDDFWAYINGRLAVDVGGMHPPVSRTIDLFTVLDAQSGLTIADLLGLENGEVYTLDIFHAERQQTGSNFELETTLFAACNVVLSGEASIDFSSRVFDNNNADETFLLNGVQLLGGGDNNQFQLQTAAQTFSSSQIFTLNQENVVRGFEITFDASVTGDTLGFAVVIQADRVVNLPLISGDSFGFEGLTNSLAIVFDLCTNRATPCSGQTVSVHYPDNANNANSPNLDTRRTFDTVIRDFRFDDEVEIQIIYFGGRPDFLEVYIDKSLYLRESDFDVASVIGSNGAHVGMTSSAGSFAGDITIKDFNIKTVNFEADNTIFQQEAFEIETIFADGEDISDGVGLITFDLCGNQLESGTLDNLIDVVFLEQVDPETNLFFNGSTVGNIVEGLVQDNDDGTYSLQLTTELAGFYSLFAAFGEDCEIVTSLNDENGLSVPTAVVQGSNCFGDDFNNGQVVVDALFVPENFTGVIDIDLGNGADVLTLALVGSAILVLGLVASILFVRYKRKWDREKNLIETGQQARLEWNTKYQGDDEYTKTGQKFLESSKEILALEANKTVDQNQGDIARLKAENAQMKESLRDHKKNRFSIRQALNPRFKKKKNAAMRTEF